MSFGEQIRLRRSELRLTRAELAERLGVSPSAVSNYENGLSFPKEDVMLRLFDCLETEPNVLFRDSYREGGRSLSASEQALLDQFHEDTDRASHFLALAQKYTDFTELTAPMLHEFVEKILVHAPDRSTGERVQEIEIYLNFIGKFEVPMPEPTEEELAAEEKRRQKRIRDHEKYLRQKERKQKIAEGLIVPGEPYQLVCQCCGEPFQSVRPNAKFCKPACREKFYRQEKRKAKETETSQTA